MKSRLLDCEDRSFSSLLNRLVLTFISCWDWGKKEKRKEKKIYIYNQLTTLLISALPLPLSFFYSIRFLFNSILSYPPGSVSSTMSSVQVQPSTTSANPEISGFDIVRCSRCQRSMSLEKSESSPGIVRFGMNSYYCSRCASMVGFTP